MLMLLDKNMSDRLLLSFFERARWRLQFAWLPKVCTFSGKRIWLEYAYEATAIWTGPGPDVIQTHWATKDEYLIWQLKQ